MALVSKRTVNQEMAERFAASVGAGHVYTSAKRNEGIDELFVSLTSTIIKKNAKQEAAVPRSDPFIKICLFPNKFPLTDLLRRQNIRILDDQQTKSKSGCC